VPRSLRNTIAATLLGLSLVVVSVGSAEGQTTGRLQVSARVLPAGPQQEGLAQARLSVSRLMEGKEVSEVLPRLGEGLILLTVRRLHPTAGRSPPEGFAVASLVYIAN